MASYDDKKRVFEDIKTLARPEQEELFRILRRMKESYTENSNGIFFDLTLISDQAFEQMKEYLRFCLWTRREHEQRLKEMETIRIKGEQYVDSDKE
jgi:dsDNA-specific endonuclease/ATPase MutS2